MGVLRKIHCLYVQIESQPLDLTSDVIRWDEKAGLRRDAIMALAFSAPTRQKVESICKRFVKSSVPC